MKCECVKTSSEVRLSGRTLFRGRILTLEEDNVLLPNGGQSTREVVRSSDSVSCCIKDGKGGYCLVRQYRYPAGKLLWEIPAGRIESGEAPEDAALREAAEETSLSCRIVKRMFGFYLAAGFATEYMHMFLMEATGPSDAVPDDDELIDSRFFTADELAQMMAEGQVEDSKTLIFLNWLAAGGMSARAMVAPL